MGVHKHKTFALPFPLVVFGAGALGMVIAATRPDLLALKPATYMNESGRAVGEAMRFLKITPEDVIVFHDELDLGAARVRVKTGGGNAGHKMQS